MRNALPMCLVIAAAACQSACLCIFVGEDGDHGGGYSGSSSGGYSSSSGESPGSGSAACTGDWDCVSGQSCLSGSCMGSARGAGEAGSSAADAGAGSVVVAVDAGAPDAGCTRDLGLVLVGFPCTTDEDCGPNGSCGPGFDLSGGGSPTIWTGGYCTATGCGPDSPCPTGSTCYSVAGGNENMAVAVCLADCGQAACRRPGYDCSALGSIWACLPDCATDADCGPGLVCDGVSCAPPCGTDSDCGAGEVCASRHCQAGAPQSCCTCEPCPRGQGCIAGFCATSCQADADCPAGERCGEDGTCR